MAPGGKNSKRAIGVTKEGAKVVRSPGAEEVAEEHMDHMAQHGKDQTKQSSQQEAKDPKVTKEENE